MIRSFGGQGTEDIFNGEDTKAARRTCPKAAWPAAARKLDLLHGAADLRDLTATPGARLEWLKGQLKGWLSIRVNDQYRVVFKWADGAADDVEILDYHP